MDPKVQQIKPIQSNKKLQKKNNWRRRPQLKQTGYKLKNKNARSGRRR